MTEFENKNIAQPSEPNRVITLGDAAKLLCCSYSTVLRLANDGELRAFRVRGAWRTTNYACEEFIRRSFGSQNGISRPNGDDDE